MKNKNKKFQRNQQKSDKLFKRIGNRKLPDAQAMLSQIMYKLPPNDGISFCSNQSNGFKNADI